MPKVSTSKSLEIRENNAWVRNTINSKVYSLYGLLNCKPPLRTPVLTQRMTPVIGSFQEVDCPPYAQVKLPLFWGCWWTWTEPRARKIKAQALHTRFKSTGLLSSGIHTVRWLLFLTARPRTSPQPKKPAPPFRWETWSPGSSKKECSWLLPLGHSKDSSDSDRDEFVIQGSVNPNPSPGFSWQEALQSCKSRTHRGNVLSPTEKSVCIKEWDQTGMKESETEEKRTEKLIAIFWVTEANSSLALCMVRFQGPINLIFKLVQDEFLLTYHTKISDYEIQFISPLKWMSRGHRMKMTWICIGV